MKTALAQTYQRTIIAGHKYSRGPTDTTPPSAPTLLTPVAALTTISVGWVNGIDAETGILDAQVDWALPGSNVWTTALVAYNNGTGVTYTIAGLTSATSYSVRVKNHDNAGNSSAYSSIATLSTLSSASDLAPGSISISATSITATEGASFSVALTRSGAGVSSAVVEADWAFSGFANGTPSPANGTIQWAAGLNGPLTLQSTAGAVPGNTTGTLSIVAVRALSGTIQPTIGIASANLTILKSVSGVKKWNPGHYAGSNQNTFLADTKRTQQIAEINEVIAQPNVLGLKLLYYSGIFGNPGAFDLSKMFRDVNLLRAAGKRIMIMIQPEIFGSGSYAELVPSAISSSSTYGTSPTAGVSGWWSINGNTGKALAWWRPGVMTGLVVPLYQAIATTVNPATGLTLDQDPFVEQICFGETSIGVDAGSDFTTAALLTQAKVLVDCWAASFKNTVCMFNNNYCGSQANSQALTSYCLANGIAQGSPDIYAIGQRGPGTYDGLTWGQKAALGALTGDANFTGSDLRGQIGMMSDIEGPELSATSRYTMYTPHSFFTVADTLLQQSHMVWTIINLGTNVAPIPAYPADGVNSGASPGNWGSVLQVINGSPITHIAKPTSIN